VVTKARRRTAIAAHVLALVTGSASLAVILAGVGSQLDLPAGASAGAIALLAGATVLGLTPPSSPWRVPRGWAQAGDTGFAAIFGFALGLGFPTLIASFGFYALVVWGLTEPWQATIPVFVAFGLARSLLLVAASFRSSQEQVTDLAAGAMRSARLARPLDAALLAALAVALAS
jgi:hypothetical protein